MYNLIGHTQTLHPHMVGVVYKPPRRDTLFSLSIQLIVYPSPLSTRKREEAQCASQKRQRKVPDPLLLFMDTSKYNSLDAGGPGEFRTPGLMQ